MIRRMRRTELREHDARSASATAAAIVVAGVPSLLLVVAAPHGAVAAGLTIAGTLAALVVGFSEAPVARPWIGWAVVGMLAVASCLRAPLGSHDLWSYAMYGRIFEHYHANPYVVRPAHFTGDAVLALVG